MQSKSKMIINKHRYMSNNPPSPAAAKREDGLLVEPAGALELQQSEGVYSDCGAA